MYLGVIMLSLCHVQPTDARYNSSYCQVFDCGKCCAEKQQFEGELVRMIENHRNSPSVIMYVVFNEGWGQYEVGTARALHGHCMGTVCAHGLSQHDYESTAKLQVINPEPYSSFV